MHVVCVCECLPEVLCGDGASDMCMHAYACVCVTVCVCVCVWCACACACMRVCVSGCVVYFVVPVETSSMGSQVIFPQGKPVLTESGYPYSQIKPLLNL